MYPLRARVGRFFFVAAFALFRIAQRSLAQHQVRDTELAPHRISYMERVPNTCLCYCSPVVMKDTRTRTTRRRIPAIGARDLISPPQAREKTTNQGIHFRGS
ncbi:hypothetical protein HDV64DRAFT_245195 [Trichoderma sp. TUCIM 5745]